MLFRRNRETNEEKDVFLIAGLGNPEADYGGTRHNVGFEVIDVLAKRHGIRMKAGKFRAESGKGRIGDKEVFLVKPQTFMNLSGESLGAFLRYYKIPADRRFLVICDDIHLPAGMLRLRTKGSDGGHNGLKNIQSHIGNGSFARLRIGVGEKPAQIDQAAYVLSRFSAEEQPVMRKAYEEAADAVETILSGGFDAAMNRYNRKAADTGA